MQKTDPFHINTNIIEFQTFIQSPTVSDEMIKKAVFVALATHHPKDLALGLGEDLAELVDVYANERAQKMTDFIAKLNAKA
jgi:hypothetical protein